MLHQLRLELEAAVGGLVSMGNGCFVPRHNYPDVLPSGRFEACDGQVRTSQGGGYGTKMPIYALTNRVRRLEYENIVYLKFEQQHVVSRLKI